VEARGRRKGATKTTRLLLRWGGYRGNEGERLLLDGGKNKRPEKRWRIPAMLPQVFAARTTQKQKQKDRGRSAKSKRGHSASSNGQENTCRKITKGSPGKGDRARRKEGVALVVFAEKRMFDSRPTTRTRGVAHRKRYEIPAIAVLDPRKTQACRFVS